MMSRPTSLHNSFNFHRCARSGQLKVRPYSNKALPDVIRTAIHSKITKGAEKAGMDSSVVDGLVLSLP
ncbi:hypothetical protein ACHWQZ_G009150 [Mnemiopsis leidyi]